MKRQQILLVTFCLIALFTQSWTRSTTCDQAVNVEKTSGTETNVVAGTQGIGALNMTKLGDKYYYIELDEKKELNWTSAQQFCRSHGLQLASVETEEENNLIGEYLRGKMPEDEDYISWGFWLSGSDSQQEGTWRWTNGQKLNFTDWWPGQPNDFDGYHDCLMIGVFNDGRHGWGDFRCSYETWFVCELEDVCS